MTTTMKLSGRLALLAVPLTVAGLVLPGTAAWATSCSETVAITVQPTTTQVNTAVTPPVVVQVDQSNGKVDQSYNGSVTLTYAVNPDSAPEPSGATVRAVKGVATFSALKFSAVGFGFELQASISGATSPASAPFDVVSELVHCSPGQTCQSGTVSSDGTSATVDAASAGTSDVLTATGGGFPQLSCGKYGGVISFSVTNRSAVVTATLDKAPAQSAGQGDQGKSSSQYNICWGAPTPFTTSSGKTATFNAANNEYEGLLPDCSTKDPAPCIKKQTTDCNGPVVTTIDAPLGDPRLDY
jgi:hypothetical protein